MVYFWPSCLVGLFRNSFCFIESFSKTGKLRVVLEDQPAALKFEKNKKGISKAALILFASVFLINRRKMKSGLGRQPNT